MRFCPSCGSRFSNDARYCPVDGQPTTELPDDAPKADPMIGAVIDGRYRVDKAIGEGGMGVVYLATHAALQKKFALKVLRGEMARDHDVVQRFVQEAQASSSIGHPNIIDISDFGRLPDGSFYFVMEYLDGESLTDLVSSSGAMRPSVAVPIIEMLASALSAAHERGIVHRDLKPDNILLVRRGQTQHFPKILDFGIAKVGGAASKLTRTGMIFGTPHYMSPEQAAGQAVDKRTDIYALGVIMYEMVTGHVPFDADTFMGILTKHMFEPPVPPTSMHQSAELGALEPVIMKALVKKPEQRYQSMDEILRDIVTLRSGGKISIAPPPMPGGAAAAFAPTLAPPQPLATASTPHAPVPAVASSPINAKTIAIGSAVLLTLGALVGVSVYAIKRMGMPEVAGTQAASAPPTSAPSTALPTGASPPTMAATIRIESDPTGAQIYDGDSIVGETPLDFPRPARSQSLVLRYDGYRDYSLSVDPSVTTPLFAALSRGASEPSRTTVATTGTLPRTTPHASSNDRRTTPPSTHPVTTMQDTTPPPRTTPVSHPPADVLDPWQ